MSTIKHSFVYKCRKYDVTVFHDTHHRMWYNGDDILKICMGNKYRTWQHYNIPDKLSTDVATCDKLYWYQLRHCHNIADELTLPETIFISSDGVQSIITKSKKLISDALAKWISTYLSPYNKRIIKKKRIEWTNEQINPTGYVILATNGMLETSGMYKFESAHNIDTKLAQLNASYPTTWRIVASCKTTDRFEALRIVMECLPWSPTFMKISEDSVIRTNDDHSFFVFKTEDDARKTCENIFRRF